MSRGWNWLASCGAVVAALSLAACGDTGDGPGGGPAAAGTGMAEANTQPATRDGRPGLDRFCGKGDVNVAYIDGFGANSWRKTTLAEIRDEAAKCPNVKVDYFNAAGAQDKYVAQFNAATAQGYKAIITFNDFGPAVLPTMRKAHKAGVVVIPFINDPTGRPGTDYTGLISQDVAEEGRLWADFMKRSLKGEGKLIDLGGTPGAKFPLDLLRAFQDAAKGSRLQLLEDKPVDTNWDPALSQKVMGGLLTKYPDIDGVLVDYLGGSAIGAMRAFLNANRPLVSFAGGSSTNETVCLWQKHHRAHPRFHILGIEGNTYAGRIALRHAVARVQRVNNPESWVLRREVGIDTTKGVIPKCETGLPPDADLWSTLPKDQLAAVLK